MVKWEKVGTRWEVRVVSRRNLSDVVIVLKSEGRRNRIFLFNGFHFLYSEQSLQLRLQWERSWKLGKVGRL